MAPETSLSRDFNIFRRCVQCPSEGPSCPTCPNGETCQLISKTCDNCAYTTCIKVGALPGQIPEPSSSTPVAPIAGGVVGGIAGLAVIVFVIWWFWLRPKKKAGIVWADEKRATLRDNQSTAASRRSVASTVMTRASNVIQIAYIPGVTVRSPPESPGFPPPVPLLPGSAPGPNGTVIGPEQHFFMPSDLRGSTYSDATTVDKRISLSPSLARTTFYGGETEEVPPVPAQQAFRAQANMVSVKSGNNTPALSQGTPRIVQQKPSMAGSSIVAKTAVARPIEIKKQGSAPRVPTLANLAKQQSSKATSISVSEKSVPLYFDEKELASPIESEKEVVSPEDSHFVSPKPSFATSNHRSSSVSGISRIMPTDGPLSSSSNNTHRHSKSEGLNAMIEQALKDAAGSAIKRPQLKSQESSPFSDAHEIDSKENTPQS
ncbi:uncharacterized protein AB675_7651 [Cyphellophora attinorum]|uniref:Membrane anchor Opy2 N-terminal domain-containing protein n=1 Tax=Cyphellophora attinorum TaxID=1664694 RepID=A0A0N1H9W7_9EURO|nr:uncharacterized protein AB675_7651 [Phialophora attinorum]KPI40592.1 hypothetical protein AB675_7651 [Phialophora attinorum]